MADPGKYAEALGLLERLSVPLRLGIWLIFTLSALIAVLKFHFPEALPAELRIVLVTAISAALLLVVLFHHVDRWYEDLPPEEPVICRSIQFLALGSKSAKKKDLIHAYEKTLIPAGFTLSEQQMKQCRGSAWELDRIVLYLYEAKKVNPATAVRFEGIASEKEKLDQKSWRGSLFPLHYAVRSAKEAVVQNGNNANLNADQKAVLEEVRRKLNTLMAKAARALGWNYRGRQIYDSCKVMLT